MLATPDFWVAISFLGFISVLIHFKVPQMIVAQLDQRSDLIKAELDQAQRMREEAQALLAEYQRKHRNAETEAAEIISLAKDDAARYKEEALAGMQDFIERKMKNAEERIARAETQAQNDIHNAAAEAAITMAKTLITEKMTPKIHADLIGDSITNISKKLN